MRVCETCDASLSGYYHNTRFCSSCRETRIRSQQAASYRRDIELSRKRSRENGRRLRARDPDRAREKQRAAYQANPERRREYQRAYYWSNVEAQREAKRASVKRNREKIRVYRRERASKLQTAYAAMRELGLI